MAPKGVMCMGDVHGDSGLFGLITSAKLVAGASSGAGAKAKKMHGL